MRIAEIYNLRSFNGDRSIGTRIGRPSVETDAEMDSDWGGDDLDADLDAAEPDEDDVVAEHLNSLEMFFEQLTVCAATENE